MNRAARIGMIAAWLGLACVGAAQAGETRCWIDNGAVVAPAAFGAIAGDFILDLSQAKSQLHETAARTAGWTGNLSRRTLRFAGRVRPGFTMTVADLDARAGRFPTNIAGVLGADMLGRSTLDLWLDPCRLRMTTGRTEIRSGERYLKTRMIAGAPAVFAAISDGLTARTGWFAIDTASAGSRIADARVSRSLPKGADAADRTSPPARLRAVSLGGVLVEQTPAGLMTSAPPGLAGAFGLAVWSRIHVRIDGRSP